MPLAIGVVLGFFLGVFMLGEDIKSHCEAEKPFRLTNEITICGEDSNDHTATTTQRG